MKIVQSTWVRYHHFDLARELNKLGLLEKIFTSLPWWKAKKESIEQNIPLDKISCNFLMQGIRYSANKLPFYTGWMDTKLSVTQTKMFSAWVAKKLPDCDAYIGISGTGLKAGRLIKNRGGNYIMDRGSSHIKYANTILKQEYERWGFNWTDIDPWLIENEIAEAEEANLITIPSDFVRDTFIGQGVDAAKLKVVPYGVSLDEFYPVGTPPADKFRLVFVGQFSLRKGAPYLLNAFKEFKHPAKELVVVGNVDEQLKPLITKLADANVIFTGIIPRNKVKDILSTAHALVLPSIEEGLALVQAQAMACGCPVIATPNTGSQTLFTNKKEGLIVEARNVEALVSAFTLLADDPLLRNKMSASCISRVKELGGWKTYTDGIVRSISAINNTTKTTFKAEA